MASPKKHTAKSRSEKADAYETEKFAHYEKSLRDQHNTLVETEALEDYQRIIQQSTLDYALRKQETLQEYLYRIEIHVEINAQKNIKSHISAPKGCWYTHKSPLGCFMCDDMNMIHYLLNLLRSLAKHQPSLVLRP